MAEGPKMGRRQQARMAQRRKRRIILLILLLVAMLLALCVLAAVYLSNQSTSTGDSEIEITEKTEQLEDADEEEAADAEEESLTESEDAEETEDAEEVEEEEDAEAEDAEEEDSEADTTGSTSTTGTTASGTSSSTSDSASSSTTASSTSSSTSDSASSSTTTGSTGSSSDSASSSTTATSTSSSSDSTSSSTTTSGSTSSGSSTTATDTIQTATLSSAVDTVVIGASGTLTCDIVSSSGNDVTAACTIVYTGSGCTVSGNSVTFDQVGTATIYATITYNGTSINTNTITITVTKAPLESVTLTCSASKAETGETATLTLVALDSKGVDITSDCTVTWKASGCTVKDGVVTLTQAGTATVKAVVSYEGTSMTTEKVTITVTDPEEPVAEQILTALIVSCDVADAELEEVVTFEVTALDQNGEALTEAVITCEGSGCTVEGTTVTLDQTGEAVITVTAIYGEVTLTESITITVHHTVTLSDGETEVDLTELGQTVTGMDGLWSLALPELLTAGEENTEESGTWSDELMGFAIAVSVTESEEADTIEALYQARLAELEALIATIEEENEALPDSLKAEVPTILSGEYDAEAGTYAITWQQGTSITSEQLVLSGAYRLSIVATWEEESFPYGTELMGYIMESLEISDETEE